MDEKERDDCVRCGAQPAVKDEEGNFTYPEYRGRGDPTSGFCGWCAPLEGFRI